MQFSSEQVLIVTALNQSHLNKEVAFGSQRTRVHHPRTELAAEVSSANCRATITFRSQQNPPWGPATLH